MFLCPCVVNHDHPGIRYCLLSEGAKIYRVAIVQLGPHRSRINPATGLQDARNGLDYGSKSFVCIVISHIGMLSTHIVA